MQACEENEEHKLVINSALTLKSDKYGTEEACLRNSHENSMYNMCIKVFSLMRFEPIQTFYLADM